MISASALNELLSSPSPALSVLDVRWQLGGPDGRAQYERAHIPEAVFVDLDAELAGPPGPLGRHPMPDQRAFEGSMRRAGVRNDRPVVVYDGSDCTAAARAWWLLRYFGHDAVMVLDGGFDAWVGSGLPLQTERPAPPPGDFRAEPGGMPMLDAQGAARVASEGVLLDARAESRYRGDHEPVDPVAGHIPGARNRPASGNVAEDARLLAPASLRAAFEELGVAPGIPVGAYCGSGVAASQQVLALELAGYDGSLYVGSWSEWITNADRPVATGVSP